MDLKCKENQFQPDCQRTLASVIAAVGIETYVTCCCAGTEKINKSVAHRTARGMNRRRPPAAQNTTRRLS